MPRRLRRLITVVAVTSSLAVAPATAASATRPAAKATTATKSSTASKTAGTTSKSKSKSSKPAAAPRVLLVGDSLMFGAKSHFQKRFGKLGIEFHMVGGPGTGLLTEQGEWLGLIDREIANFSPQVVVIEACCNYAWKKKDMYRMADGTVVQPDTKAMYRLWKAYAKEAVKRASVNGAEVLWVHTPPVSPDRYEGQIAARTDRFNAIYDDLGVPLINWASVLTVDGSYVDRLPMKDGTSVKVRTSDGLHFTSAGSARIATLTVNTVSDHLATTMAAASTKPAKKSATTKP